jgi:16S rRNA processing protein RimM
LTEPTGAEGAGWVVVGRIGRAHGVRGDVSVEVRTDQPDQRFAEGAALRPDRGGREQLTVAGRRWHGDRLLVHFDGVDDRSSAETLRGVLLQVAIDPTAAPADPDEYYDHQLVGLEVVDVTGAPLGRVKDVVHGAQDLLVVAREAETDADVLVPFVQELVPEVDLRAGRVVTQLPDGLIDLGREARD